MIRKIANHYMIYAAVALIGLVMLGCDAAEPGRYYNSEYHFSIVFPPGWQIDVDPTDYTVSAWEEFENDDDMFQENMTIGYEELIEKTTLEAYYYEVNHNSRMDLANWTVEKEGELAIDSQPAKAIRSTFTMAEGMLKMIGYCVIKDEHAITISCLVEPHNYDKYQPIFKEAVQGFRFE